MTRDKDYPDWLVLSARLLVQPSCGQVKIVQNIYVLIMFPCGYVKILQPVAICTVIFVTTLQSLTQEQPQKVGSSLSASNLLESFEHKASKLENKLFPYSSMVGPAMLNIMNLSLTTGTVPSTFKAIVIKLLLKKPGVDPEVLGSYRPISNLSGKNCN